MMQDILGGQIPMMFINQDTALPHIKADKLEATMKKKIMTSPNIRLRMESIGFIVPEQGGAAYTKFVKSAIERWTHVIKTAGIKAQ